MAIAVPRPNLNWRERMFLPAIAAGLLITLKHFKNMIFRRTKVTMEYPEEKWDANLPDRKSTRLNSSHSQISYAVFCLKKKKHNTSENTTCACHYAGTR